jgi:hypothetical protein
MTARVDAGGVRGGASSAPEASEYCYYGLGGGLSVSGLLRRYLLPIARRSLVVLNY